MLFCRTYLSFSFVSPTQLVRDLSMQSRLDQDPFLSSFIVIVFRSLFVAVAIIYGKQGPFHKIN